MLYRYHFFNHRAKLNWMFTLFKTFTQKSLMIIFNELVLQILIRIMKDIRNRFDQLKDLSVWNIELIVC